MPKLHLASFTVAAALVGCTEGSPDRTPFEPLVPAEPLPTATGTYAASYRVPTEDALAAAAVYPVDHAEWTVVDGTVTLHYELPLGLVGGLVEVTLAGPIAPGATRIDLAGAVGTGACVATTTTITCQETFGDLGALPISMTVVEQMAAREYSGPAADRVAVALQFGSDPIGIVDIDLRAPIVED